MTVPALGVTGQAGGSAGRDCDRALCSSVTLDRNVLRPADARVLDPVITDTGNPRLQAERVCDGGCGLRSVQGDRTRSEIRVRAERIDGRVARINWSRERLASDRDRELSERGRLVTRTERRGEWFTA